ncbi:MAG: hypothetical protein ABEL76_09995 [Bradymonadaceae bacterium]
MRLTLPFDASRLGLVCLVLFGLAAAGCAGKQDTSESTAEKVDEPKPPRARYDNLTREGKKVETFDLDKDGQADQWRLSEGRRVVRLERDMNFDGRVDVWQYKKGGNLVEEEMDLDLDGRIDLVVFYENGKLNKKKISLDFRQGFSIAKFYSEDGTLLRVERDKDGDGKPDLFEYYDDEGNRERVGWDDNGDGVPDSFDRLP